LIRSAAQIDVSLCERYRGILDTTQSAGDDRKHAKHTAFLFEITPEFGVEPFSMMVARSARMPSW